MDTNSIRELLSQGQTGQALEALLTLIRQDARYKNNLTRTLEVLQAGYERTRQQEQKGIVSFQEAQREYSRVADAVLSILGDVETGRVPAEALRRSRMPLWIGAGVLVAGLAVWLIFGWGDAAAEPACPDFDRSADKLSILVVPFDPLDSMTANIESRIQEDISALTQKAGIPAEVKLVDRGAGDLSALDVAERRGKRCSADLVIYGQYKAFTGDSLRVKLGYKFLGGEEKTGNTPFQPFRDITEVVAPRDFQDALFSVCAMLAMREKNWAFAQRWMDKIKEKDAQEIAMAKWMAEQPKN